MQLTAGQESFFSMLLTDAENDVVDILIDWDGDGVVDTTLDDVDASEGRLHVTYMFSTHGEYCLRVCWLEQDTSRLQLSHFLFPGMRKRCFL